MSEIPAAPVKPAIHKVRRRRTVRRIINTVLLLILVAALGLGGYWYYSQQQAKKVKANEVTYQTARVQTGSMDKFIFGSGTVKASDQPTILAQTDGTLNELRVEVGDAVKKGQVLAVLKNDDLDDQITQLEYALWNADSTITATGAGEAVVDIKSPCNGRVMKLYAKEGDDALAVYRRMGSVALLSTDGRMKVDISVNDGIQLAYGDTVTVQGDGFTEGGTVTDLYMQDTRATVTILTDKRPLDAPVEVLTKDGKAIGNGTLAINKPMAVSGFGGTIRKVQVQEGSTVFRKQQIFLLEDSPITLKTENLRIQRETAATDLAKAQKKRDDLIVRAPADGTIASVTPVVGDTIASGSAICSVLQGNGMYLDISVDELDIVSVAQGQDVTISLDALPGTTLNGKVEKIAPTGSGEGGVASYSVRISFDAAGTAVRPGMNASGQVQVAHVEDALSLPVAAIMTMNNKKYVMVAGSDAVQQLAEAQQSMQQRISANSGTQPNAAQQSAAQPAAVQQDTTQQSANAQPQSSTDQTAQGEGRSQRRNRQGNAGNGQGNFTKGDAIQGGFPQGGNGQGNFAQGDTSQATAVPDGVQLTGAAQPFTAQSGTAQTATQGNASQTRRFSQFNATITGTADSGTLVEVTLGLTNDTRAQILSGLNQGDIVLYRNATSSSTGNNGNRNAMTFVRGF